MTEYWIRPDVCNRVIGDLRDLMTERNSSFQYVDDNRDGIEQHSFADRETTRNQSDAIALDAAYRAFFEEKLVPQFEKIVGMIEYRTDLMQEVVNYYLSGDAEMQHNSQKLGLEYPELQDADGSAYSGADPGAESSLTGGNYQQSPYQFLETNRSEDGEG